MQVQISAMQMKEARPFTMSTRRVSLYRRSWPT